MLAGGHSKAGPRVSRPVPFGAGRSTWLLEQVRGRMKTALLPQMALAARWLSRTRGLHDTSLSFWVAQRRVDSFRSGEETSCGASHAFQEGPRAHGGCLRNSTPIDPFRLLNSRVDRKSFKHGESNSESFDSMCMTDFVTHVAAFGLNG